MPHAHIITEDLADLSCQVAYADLGESLENSARHGIICDPSRILNYQTKVETRIRAHTFKKVEELKNEYQALEHLVTEQHQLEEALLGLIQKDSSSSQWKQNWTSVAAWIAEKKQHYETKKESERAAKAERQLQKQNQLAEEKRQKGRRFDV